MAVNRGKQFEGAVRSALSSVPNVSVDRLYDPTAGYAGIQNICDFIVYRFPYIIYLECKSVHGNTLNFSLISKNQWEGLLEKSKIPGVIAGVLVWFVDTLMTAFVPIEELVLLKDEGCKSLHINDLLLDVVSYVELHGIRKRVLFDYSSGADDFLTKVVELNDTSRRT